MLEVLGKESPDGLPLSSFEGFFESEAEKKFVDTISELHALLDKKQIKKGLKLLRPLVRM